MKFWLTAFVMLTTVGIKASPLFQSDTTRQKLDTVSVTPNNLKAAVRALPYAGYFGKDEIAFQTYAGLNVINTLRGHLPFTSFNPNANDVMQAGARGNNFALAIDGLPFPDDIGYFYNLNAFDYERISVLSNGATPFGGLGAYGMIFLNSKSGKGLVKPRIEFNSYNSFIGIGDSDDGGADPTFEFTESISYAQDYGPVDLRVSYTGTFMPESQNNAGAFQSTGDNGLGNLRLNIGADLTEKLNMRLLLDRWSSFTRSSSSRSGTDARTNQELGNLQGNFSVEFRPTQWLTLSSQAATAGIDGNYVRRDDNKYILTMEKHRRFLNLFATGKHSYKTWRFTEYAGVQYDRSRDYRSQLGIYNDGATISETKAWYTGRMKSLIAGASVGYSSWVGVDFNYRLDQVPQWNTESIKSWSLAGYFLVSDLLGIQSGQTGFAKVRANVGMANLSRPPQFPESPSTIITDPEYGLTNRDLFEVGMEISPAKGLIIRANYFDYVNDKTPTTVWIPSGANGATQIVVNAGALRQFGWEAILSANIIDRGDVKLATELIWSPFKSEFKSNGTPTTGVIGSVNPDWVGSLLTQFSSRKIFASLLVDVTQGASYYSTYGMRDGSFAKLRDISVGYQFPSEGTWQAMISLSGRNLVRFYSAEETDYEAATSFYGAPKSLCLSLSFRLQ